MADSDEAALPHQPTLYGLSGRDSCEMTKYYNKVNDFKSAICMLKNSRLWSASIVLAEANAPSWNACVQAAKSPNAGVESG
ncbi:hypothetical protein [Hymenobacter antarcticus]|uniref:hypothetical protein n=1 Tax=Hymenobacter antarcticus TaxID=486270 RepID=UPI0031EE75FF